MKTNVEVLESGATKLTVTIEAAEIDRRIKKAYKDFGKKYKFPGFRPGHVPRPVIDSHLGKDYVLSQVTNDAVNESYAQALNECDLIVIGNVTFDDVEGLVQDGSDFVFSANLQAKPELELFDYAPVHVEIPFKTASEAEVDEQIERLANDYCDYKNAPANTKVKADSVIDITLVATDDKGEKIPMLCAEERIYELGKGMFPAALDEALVGLKKGESTSVTLKASENPSLMISLLRNLETENITFDATVVAVKKKVLPEITDEWIKENLKDQSSAETVEQLREQLAGFIEQEKTASIPRIKENNALYALQERLVGEVPESMVEEAQANLLQTFFGQLQSMGMTFDIYLAQQGITAEQFKEDVKRQASDVARQNLALDAYARHAGFTVSDEELFEEFKMAAGTSDPRKLLEEWKAEGRLPMVREGILRRKAVIDIVEAAEVEEVEKLSSADEEKKPAKKSSKKKAAKKEEAPAGETESAEGAPAAE